MLFSWQVSEGLDEWKRSGGGAKAITSRCGSEVGWIQLLGEDWIPCEPRPPRAGARYPHLSLRFVPGRPASLTHLNPALCWEPGLAPHLSASATVVAKSLTRSRKE
jgi:hypothetical protein